jgi:yeast amino acid transporter
LDEIPFRAALGVFGSCVGLCLNILCLIAQFYVALFPIGKSPTAESFFQAYLAFPIVIVYFIVWKVVKKTKYVRLKDVDLVTGRREMNLRELQAQEHEEEQKWTRPKRYIPS